MKLCLWQTEELVPFRGKGEGMVSEAGTQKQLPSRVHCMCKIASKQEALLMVKLPSSALKYLHQRAFGMTLLKANQQMECLFRCTPLLLPASQQTCHGFYDRNASLASL